MIMRKGYLAEYQAKQKLISEFGKENVIKVAIGGATDYIIVSGSQIVKIVEVKSAKKKWYPKPREKRQIQRIVKFAKEHNMSCTCKYEAYHPNGVCSHKLAALLYILRHG